MPLLWVQHHPGARHPSPQVRGLPTGGRATTLVWVRRCFSCNECEVRHWETHPEIILGRRTHVTRRLVRDVNVMSIREVVLAGISDTPTLDYISRLIGDETAFEEYRTRNADGRESVTEPTQHRPLASTADLRRADTGTGVLVYGNFHPAQLKLRPLKPLTTRANRGGHRAWTSS